MLVFQGNPMGVECSRKKTISFYIYKGRMTTTAVSKPIFELPLAFLSKRVQTFPHENEFNLWVNKTSFHMKW